MGKTAIGPYQTLFAFGTPFREVDNGGTADDTVALPVIGHLAIRDVTLYSNGYTLCNTAKYGATMETLVGDLYVLEIMPKHPHSTVPYDRTTALVVGDPILVHKLEAGNELWLPCVSETIVEGEHLVTKAGGTITTIGVGGAIAPAHYFKALAPVVSAAGAYAHVLYMGVAGVDVT
jgi:hypothetical protein